MSLYRDQDACKTSLFQNQDACKMHALFSLLQFQSVLLHGIFPLAANLLVGFGSLQRTSGSQKSSIAFGRGSHRVAHPQMESAAGILESQPPQHGAWAQCLTT